MRYFLILLFSINIYATQMTVESCIKTFDMCIERCHSTCSLDGTQDKTCTKECKTKRDKCLSVVFKIQKDKK